MQTLGHVPKFKEKIPNSRNKKVIILWYITSDPVYWSEILHVTALCHCNCFSSFQILNEMCSLMNQIFDFVSYLLYLMVKPLKFPILGPGHVPKMVREKSWIAYAICTAFLWAAWNVHKYIKLLKHQFSRDMTQNYLRQYATPWGINLSGQTPNKTLTWQYVQCLIMLVSLSILKY